MKRSFEDRRTRSKKQYREIERIKHSLGSVSSFVGEKSEELAELICREAVQEGSIKNFWRIAPRSILDWRGIDIICETPNGFFLLNVKKSSTGVISFRNNARPQRDASNFLLIYPWRVGLELADKGFARLALKTILMDKPSFSVLPEEIKRELINPTYPARKTRTKFFIESLDTELRDDIRREVAKLNKIGLCDLTVTVGQVWVVRLSGKIKGAYSEVTGQDSKATLAERKAYEELVKKLKAP